MYKLMIVDDEQIEREGMAQFIPWKKYDVELVGTAWNGLDAFEQIQEKHPDIVLTDIKMPVMNGIELIKKITENFSDICIIVLSGYGEYEFTSQAMEYGVRHYLLKPCDEEKIVSVLEEAKKELEKNREQQRKEQEYHKIRRRMLPRAKEEMFRRLLQSKELTEDEQDLLQQELPDIRGQVLLLAIKSNGAGFDYLEQFIFGNILGEILEMKEMPLSTSIDEMVVFLLDASVEEHLEKAVERTKQEFSRIKTKKITAVVSKAGAFGQMDALYRQLLYLYTLGEQNGRDGYFSYAKLDMGQENSDYFFDFARIRRAKTYDEILFEITFALKKMSCRNYSMKQKTKMGRVFALAWGQKEHLEEEEMPDVESMETEEELLPELAAWVAKNLDLYATDKEGVRMQQILDIIYQNLDKTELNIQYLAKEILFMNEDYFGRLFIRTMKIKFSAYLEETRIHMAKRLLAYNNDMKISSLTELVGYPPDGQYFSKAFRKVCGKTPTEYREELKKEETEKSNFCK